MKFVILLLLSFSVSAKLPQVVTCLAQEEYAIHKNPNKQHQYQLNQNLVNEFAAESGIDLKRNKISAICHNNTSERLLQLLLIEGKSVFEQPRGLLENERYILETAISTLLDRTVHIFFQYLLVLENKTQSAGCLQKEIPEIAYFSTQFQDLQVEISRKRLLSDKSKIKKLFEGLKNFESIKKKCQSLKKEES